MTQVTNLVNQQRGYGEELPDHRVIEKVLRSLPKRFKPAVAAIEEAKDTRQMHVDELTSSLVSHESRMNIYEDRNLDHAFKS